MSDIQASRNEFHQRKTEAEKQIRSLQGKNHRLEEAIIDRYSGANIIKMVEALNAEIFQGAALISELPGDETMIEVDKLLDTI